MFSHGKIVRRILLVNFQLYWSDLKMLTFEPLYNPLMTFYKIAYVLSCLECHRHNFSHVSGQLEHFENVEFRTPL